MEQLKIEIRLYLSHDFLLLIEQKKLDFYNNKKLDAIISVPYTCIRSQLTIRKYKVYFMKEL